MSKPWEAYQSNPSNTPGVPLQKPVEAKPWEKYKGESTDSLKSALLEGAVKTGEFVDKYTQGPIRAGLLAGKQAYDQGGFIPAIKEGISAGAKELLPNQPLPPSGKELFKAYGASDKPIEGLLGMSPAGIGGTAFELFGPNVPGLGLGRIGKTASKALKATGETLGATKQAIKSNELILKATQKADQLANKIFSKSASALTGVNENLISTYSKNVDEVNNLINKYGREMGVAADDLRGKFQSQIQNVRKLMNAQISEALKARGNVLVKSGSIVDELEKFKGGLNPKTKASDIKEIDDLINVVRDLSPDGNMTVRNLFDVKEFLMDRAKRAYQKEGQIFMAGKESQQAAKRSGAIARKLLNEASPDIAQANNKLALLHTLEEKVDKKLLTPGKPENMIMVAGSSPGSRPAKQLKMLENTTGIPATVEAQKIAAAKEFANPEILPKDATGKSATRMMTAAGAGFLAGGPKGAAVASALTSPAALKVAINAGNISKKALKSVFKIPGQITDATLVPIYKALTGPQGPIYMRELTRLTRGLGQNRGLLQEYEQRDSIRKPKY